MSAAPLGEIRGNKSLVSLWRILGNDLPPRHEPGQTRRNLQFVLDHEPALAQSTRHWIVNRLVDPREEERLIALLDRHAEPYLRIPFRLDEFLSCQQQDLSSYPLLSELVSPQDRRRHSKCLYVMNLNAARNLAIEEGRRSSDWILPLDGNCCFRKDGWQQLIDTLANRDDRKRCFAVPMYRLKKNSHYLDFSTMGRSAQEPQLLVGRDCDMRFHPLYRYGRDSKVELLERLAFPCRKGAAHEVSDPDAVCGYVMRLHSGVTAGEEHWERRAELREQGIDALLERLDRMAASHRPAKQSRDPLTFELPMRSELPDGN